MTPYKNQRGNSGVIAYDSGPDYIDVQFRDGAVYRYSDQVPGQRHVEMMRLLALKGQGLTTYINQHIHAHYALRRR